MSQVYRINDDIIGIDLMFQGIPGVIISWLVRTRNGWCAVDCGPASTVETFEHGVNASGLAMGDISRLVLTHIHLDHAGGSGLLVRRHPHLRISVHEGASGFVVDPSRLLASAARSYGDRMEQFWGETIGAPASSIDVLRDGESVPDAPLRAIASPGHSGTHLAYIHTESEVLITGDVCHARLQDSDVIIPTLSPIELDFDLWHQSAERLRSLRPGALALPHGGFFEDAESHLAQIEDRIWDRINLAEQVLTSPDDQDALAQALLRVTRAEYESEGGDIEQKLLTMEYCMPSWLGAQGIVRWFKVQGRFQ